MPNDKPIIGVTLDSETAGGYSNAPWYALRTNYCDSIVDAGGIPLALPHNTESVPVLLGLCDGFVVTGGGFDIPAEMFGEATRPDTSLHKPRRTEFEMALARGAMERDMPVLGICGGQQLLGVLLGGKLVQHIPDDIENALDHNPGDTIHDVEMGAKKTHKARIAPDTLLARIVGTDEIDVNTSHHQAVCNGDGDGMAVNATAPDGVVEGVESPAHRFCLGVQWHPEYQMSAQDTAIIEAFVAACRTGK